MKRVWRASFFTALAISFFFGTSFADAPVPPSPSTYVVDEARKFPNEDREKIEVLLKEHELATSEQIVIALFESLNGEDLFSRTHAIFQNWKIGKKGKDNGVLLALYLKDRKTRIEVGYGMEDRLTDAKSKRILDETLSPLLKSDEWGHALIATSVAILREVGSPLIENGRAEQILGGDFQSFTPARNPLRTLFVCFLIFFALTLGASLYAVFHPDFQASSGQWHPVDPFLGTWRRRRRSWGVGWDSPNRWGGGSGSGGIFGGGGGFGGGFSGGGGSSGGGGASGGW